MCDSTVGSTTYQCGFANHNAVENVTNFNLFSKLG